VRYRLGYDVSGCELPSDRFAAALFRKRLSVRGDGASILNTTICARHQLRLLVDATVTMNRTRRRCGDAVGLGGEHQMLDPTLLIVALAFDRTSAFLRDRRLSEIPMWLYRP
jgi:hypothetical protein